MDGNGENSKPRDLEERTRLFAKGVRTFVKLLPRTVCNAQDVKQLARSSGSVAANYIEANEAVSRKDFALRIKYCRKEAKESHLWLDLLDMGEKENCEKLRAGLMQEAQELKLIFAAILRKSEEPGTG